MEVLSRNATRFLHKLWIHETLLFTVLTFLFYEFLLQKSALRVSLPFVILSPFFLFQGQFFSGGNFRIYLLGNPVIWWSNLVFLAVFLLTYLLAAIRKQRGYGVVDSVDAESK